VALGAGALSLKRFQILSKQAPCPLNEALKKLQQSSIDPLEIDDARQESSGFCHPFTGEPSGVEKDPVAVLDGENIIFGYRIDNKKVPGTLFRLQLKQALDSLKKQTNQEKDEKNSSKNAHKKFREAAKERIKEELLKRTLPNIKLLEIIWNLNSGEILVTSTTQSVAQKFITEFENVFDVKIIECNPGILALKMHEVLIESENGMLELKKANNLKPCAFNQRASGSSKKPRLDPEIQTEEKSPF
jgi:DNA recombination-dependent growth factor C